MSWSPFAKQPAMDSVDQSDAIIDERLVQTAAVPVCRFVKLGSADGTCVLTGDADRAIGVSRESNGPRADVTAGTYSDYAVADKAPIVERTTKFVYVEAFDQTLTTVADNAPITSAASGKSRVALTGEIINGRAAKVNPLVTDRAGVKYIRLMPTWHIKEALP